jgi:hypothetical protein
MSTEAAVARVSWTTRPPPDQASPERPIAMRIGSGRCSGERAARPRANGRIARGELTKARA